MTVKPLGALGAVLTAGASAGATAVAALWTFPSMLLSAFVVAWGAEAAQFLISQGLALAALAWLQTLPEFAVEAVIAWNAGRDAGRMHLAVANLTGAIRLLIGLGWPMIYFVAAFFGRKTRGRLPTIVLEREHAIEVVGLVPPLAWFVVIWLKGSIGWADAVVLVALYLAYLVVLLRVPPHEEEELADAPAVSRWAYNLGGKRRVAAIVGLFAAGGVLLYLTAKPFLESMLGIAAVLGVSDFVFVQWVAPFLSEFPEKVSAFYWAQRVDKAPMALMNMVSSNINQWTILAAMIPLVYGWSHAAAGGGFVAFRFDAAQELEIALTLAQSFLALLLLMEMKFDWWDATLLFVLWLAQFLRPHWRAQVLALYLLWSAGLIAFMLAGRRPCAATRIFLEVVRAGRRPPEPGNAAPRA
ncbi:MAG: sodium:calcium antiporter [Gemmatimonadales bacterium]|jgi:cation:H+ antiporter